MPASICLVSPGNLASNPRLIKEADALHDAGYRVAAIACSYTEALQAYDDEIARTAGWTAIRVPRPAGERVTGAAARLAGRVMDAVGLDIPVDVAAAAYGGPFSALRTAALQQRADLYIAHYVAALPAAAAAAARHGALLGFDAEDFHSGEGQGGEAEEFRMELVKRIEESALPSCRHFTAASPLIARAYGALYGVTPTTVLNVFPLSMAPASPAVSPPAGGGLRAYWFSQTIGLDRGLQSFIAAMARARTRVTLDIRGGNRWGHGETLLALARDLGIGDRVSILPMEAPERMVTLAAGYDLGLSLETDATQSRRLCLTNKIFTYLLAGIPVLMSDTPAQSELAPQLGAAGLLGSLDDPRTMAHALDSLGNPEALGAAKAAAWRLGRERYNWDHEKKTLLASVAAALGTSTASSAGGEGRP
jgi:glycosyltransferase involved in cell wall biosynthesis